MSHNNPGDFRLNDQLLRHFEEAGISAYRLAQLSGVSHTCCIDWKKRKTKLNTINAEAIATALGCRIDVVKKKEINL